MLRPDFLARLLAVVAHRDAAVAAPASARSPEIYTGILSSTAVGGYDPVAYFTRRQSRSRAKRNSAIAWKGVTWRFANAKNLEAFKAKPETYAPQYGGYCAWAVSQGYTAKGDPKAWSIVDGKLYLNYNADVQEDLGKGCFRQHRQGGQELAEGPGEMIPALTA